MRRSACTRARPSGAVPGRSIPRLERAHSIPVFTPPAASSLRMWLPDNAPPSAPAALCLAGQIRVLTYSWVQDNLLNAVIRPLRSAVFMHVSRQSRACGKRGPAAHRGVVIDCASTAALTSRVALDTIINRLAPTSLSLQDDAVLLQRHNLSGGLAPGVVKDMPVGCMGSTCAPLLLRYAGCASDIERFEAERSHRFGWVVRARPDLLWHCRLPELTAAVWPPQRSRTAFTYTYRDWLAVFSRQVATPALRLHTRLAQSQSCGSRGSHEQLLCLDALLETVNASWCELLQATGATQHLLPMSWERLSGAAPVKIQREVLAQGKVPAQGKICKAGQSGCGALPWCKLCRPEPPKTDRGPTSLEAKRHCRIRNQLGGGGPSCPPESADDD